MTTSFNESDHPRSGDGKFAPKAHAEADGVTLTPAGDRLTPIEIEKGDEEFGFPTVVGSTVMNSVSVYRDEDGAHTAYGTQNFRYSEWAPNELEDEDDVWAWGQRNQAIIDAVIQERYAGATVNSDGDEANVRFDYELGDGVVTEEDLIDKMSTGPAVNFYNESDDGTYGTENLSRIIREKVARSAMVSNPYDRDATDHIRAMRASGLVHEGPSMGHVSDEKARAVAAEAAYMGDYPHLRQFAERGWSDHERMLEEIGDANAAGNITGGAEEFMIVWLDEHPPKP